MNRIKWEDALDAYDMLETIHDLDESFNGQIVRQYLEQPRWTFTVGLLGGAALGVLAAVAWRLLA